MANEKPDWFTVFRTDTDEENAGWLYTELTEGRLRQGWGAPGFALETADGRRVEKTQWEAAYKAHWKEDPSLRRFAILTRMLDMEEGSVVVVPKMPEWNQFTIARVSGRYRFEIDGEDRKDFRHIVPVHRGSVRRFGYHADNDAFLISGLFARANHWSGSLFVTTPSRSRRPTGYCNAKAAQPQSPRRSCPEQQSITPSRMPPRRFATRSRTGTDHGSRKPFGRPFETKATRSKITDTSTAKGPTPTSSCRLRQVLMACSCLRRSPCR